MSVNIESGIGTARGSDSYEVGRQAATTALETISTHRISAALVFASCSYDLPSVLQGIRSVVPEAPLFGATTAGEICNGALTGSVVVTIIASPYLKVSCGLGKEVAKDWHKAVNQALSAPSIEPYFNDVILNEELALAGKSVFAVLFSPGNTRTATSRSHEILESIKQRSLGSFQIFGGAAADDWNMERNAVLLDTNVHYDSMVLAIFETELQYGMAVAHGFTPTGSRLSVTEVDGHEILEFNCEPAANTYAWLSGVPRSELDGGHITLTTGYAMGVADPFEQYSINIASYSTDRGGIMFTQPVPVGTEFTLMKAAPEVMVDAGRSALIKAMMRGRISSPALTLVAYCALRTRLGGNQSGYEIQTMAEHLHQHNLAGFFSFGEQGVADNGTTVHNNGMVSVLMFGDNLAPEARVSRENKALYNMLQQQKQEIFENRLNETEHRFRHLFEQVPNIAVQGYNRNRQVIFWNRASEELYGYSRGEAIGRQLEDLIIPEPMKEGVVQAVCGWVDNGIPIPAGELVLQTKQGQPVHVFSSHVMQKNQAGEPEMFCLDIDLSEQKQTEIELSRKNHELEQFLYTVSHDLRSPLVTIKTFLGFLERDLTDNKFDRVHTDFGFINTAADRMVDLLSELVEISKVGRDESDLDTVTCHEIISQALSAVAGNIAERDVAILTSYSSIRLRGNPRRFLQIFQNLLENALKFTVNNPNPCIRIALTGDSSDTVFSICDNGIGILPEYHERIFNIFEKLDPGSMGTGVGLTIVKRIVELYGGKIWIKSDGENQGTCVLFTLPDAVVN